MATRELKFRAISMNNKTDTLIESAWIVRLSWYKLMVSFGLSEYRKVFNNEARKLQQWRRDFYAN